jgi:hypothetical protein
MRSRSRVDRRDEYLESEVSNCGLSLTPMWGDSLFRLGRTMAEVTYFVARSSLPTTASRPANNRMRNPCGRRRGSRIARLTRKNSTIKTAGSLSFCSPWHQLHDEFIAAVTLLARQP